MNDNQPLAEFDIPDWAWDIIDRHDLGFRTDNPRAAVTVLLTDAAEILKEAGATAFREAAVSIEVEGRARDALAIVTDAISLAVLCRRDPAPGIVTELEDGTLQRRDADAPDLPDDLDPPPEAGDEPLRAMSDWGLLDE